jgi:hypothetical protein
MAGIPHHVINRASRRSVIFGVDDDYRTFMKWLTGTQTQQWHARIEPPEQGRSIRAGSKPFPVQSDHHFWTLARYVQRNPVRARLVRRIEEWRSHSGSVNAQIRRRARRFLR